MARPFAPMTAKIENCIRMEARGETADDILREIFGVDPETCDPKEKNKLYQQMFRWRHRPDAQAIWEDEIKIRVKRCLPRAMSRVDKQIDDDNGWLANKASNDLINLAKLAGIVTSEEQALNVRIEGLPEIGSPEKPEEDV